MANALTPLFEHNLWANLVLMEACSVLDHSKLELTIPGVYGTPASTLVHLLAGEQAYVSRLAGDARTLRTGDPWPGIDALVEYAGRSGRRLRELAESVSLSDTIRTEFDGASHEIDASVVLVQAINHSTEHRAHIVTTLSAHGIVLPEIDGWNWGEATGRLRTPGA